MDQGLCPPAALPDDPRDPFRVLSLPYDAGAADVRRAFRRLARQTHPDRGGSPDAFHAVRAAYGALADNLDAERQRWQPAPARRASRYAAGLDPAVYPTCRVRVTRRRDGRREVAYDASPPEGWRPGAAAPPGGVCQERHAATGTAPAFGIWTVPLDAHRFRCVFGP